MNENIFPLDEFKKYGKEQDWVVYYGRIDFANLEGIIEPNKIHLFILSQNFTPNLNNYSIANYTCQCMLLLVKQGDIGDTHAVKYEKNIKELVLASNDLVSYLKSCGVWRPTAWNSVSVINRMDDLVDGLNINATLRGNVC